MVCQQLVNVCSCLMEFLLRKEDGKEVLQLLGSSSEMGRCEYFLGQGEVFLFCFLRIVKILAAPCKAEIELLL